ncbi:MAG: lysophospholipid acyltransferase family protein [Bacteroidota bacterium]|nr:lysophospholipid acyltransferase family protein [Candidatus Kapabacteria bacterium]MDW8219378.1 lysophospholipid acyltransferase family protein [Bacteroidota bacterium]
MIVARHQCWAHILFRPYLRSLIRRRFHALHLLDAIPFIPESLPILLLPNHSSWWDGFIPYLLNDICWQREYYIMMLEHRLREFWFFRFLGAFSINQQSPKDILQALDYAAHLLSGKRLVVLFPQGKLLPSRKRPLGYHRGVERILQRCITSERSVAILPLAMRYEFLGDEKPHIFLLFGSPIVLPESAPPTAHELEYIEILLLSNLEDRIAHGEQGTIVF